MTLTPQEKEARLALLRRLASRTPAVYQEWHVGTVREFKSAVLAANRVLAKHNPTDREIEEALRGLERMQNLRPTAA